MKVLIATVFMAYVLSCTIISGQEIPEIPCTGGSNEEKCTAACEAGHPGTIGVCQNDLCACSKDPLDLKCGGDGSFGGLKCPDLSACQRHCCRAGHADGTCWFGLECRCRG